MSVLDFEAFEPFGVPISGRNLVNASAGTGKTYAITTIVVRLLVETELTIDRILVVTFTEAATAELRSRIRSRIRSAADAFRFALAAESTSTGDAALEEYVRLRQEQQAALGDTGALEDGLARLNAALANIDQAPISTIHGFCFGMLQNAAFETEVPFDTEMLLNTRPLMDQVCDDYWASQLYESSLDRLRLLLRGPGSLSRDGLRPLVDKVLGNPEIRLTPPAEASPAAETTATASEALSRRLAESLEAAREAWDAPEILSLLAKDPGLTGKGIRPAKSEREKWCTILEEYFRRPYSPAVQVPKELSKLGSPQLTRKGGRVPSHPFFQRCDEALDVLLEQDEAAHRERISFKHNLLQYAVSEYHRRKDSAGQLSFDDLLLILRNALRSSQGEALIEATRARFGAALIDEFQDTDPVQFEIFRTVYATESGPPAPLFMIGDPKQAIYAFRGADVFAYLEALKTTNARRYTMDVNWRSDPSLLSALNTLFGQSVGQGSPFLIEEIEYTQVSPRPGAANKPNGNARQPKALDFLFAEREGGSLKIKKELNNEIPLWIAADVSRLLRSDEKLEERPISAGDIAILTRTNAQCFEIQESLRKLQIPAVVVGDQNVFASADAEELQYVLVSVLEPNNPRALRKALVTDVLGLRASDIEGLEASPQAWDRWALRFRSWHQLWRERGFVQMFKALLQDSGAPGRLLALLDGERRMTNLLHLMELLHVASRQQHLGPASLVHWLAKQRSDVLSGASAPSEQTEIRLESDADAVKLTTIHKSKGLEFPLVYCPYLWDGKLLFRSERSDIPYHDPETGRLNLDIGSKEARDHLELAEFEALAENMRLLYVALTRAKHRVTVLWGGFKDLGTSALGLLLHATGSNESTAGVDLASLKNRFRKVDDAELKQDLETLVEKAPSDIGLRWVALDEPGQRVPTSEHEQVPTPARRVHSAIASWRKTTSFSGLTHSNSSSRPSFHEQTKDRDGAPVASRLTESYASAEESQRHPIPLLGFPKGANSGNFFHEVLEHLDFRLLSSAETSEHTLEALVQEQLLKHGIQSELSELARSGLQQALGSPIGGPVGSLQLCAISPAERLNEMEFLLPAAAGKFNAESLSTALATAPGTTMPINYPEQLRTLEVDTLDGFLKGFIDLIFEQGGRYYVADYKTNHLGDHVEDYDQAAMLEAMAHSHYFLQYHLYSIATHRHLQQCLPNYNYETHFGGVYYLFLKGMTQTVPGYGVYFERPPLARMLALDSLFQAATLRDV